MLAPEDFTISAQRGNSSAMKAANSRDDPIFASNPSLLMLAFISINLGVLNLLPIPVLDGGHLAFFAIEGAMRRPLRARHREIALQVGILLIITLIVFVSYNDIHRLVWG